TRDPPRPTALVPGLPVELEAVCLKCLEKEPARRYPSAAALAEDLRRFRDGLPVTVLPLQVFDHDARWARKFDHEIVEAIGGSTMAVAYLARHVGLGRAAVLHRCAGPPGSPQDQAMQRAGGALAILDHPNVIWLHDYGQRHEQAYLITEFVDGGS